MVDMDIHGGHSFIMKHAFWIKPNPLALAFIAFL